MSLVRSIIFQQLSTASANYILKKFTNLFDGKIKPESILNLKDSDFKKSGVSNQKMNYLRDLSLKFKNKEINVSNFKNMSDEEIRQHLIQVKGIGRWTADMFLIFALNRENVLPTGDLAIVNGFIDVFNLKEKPNEEKMYELALPYIGRYTYLSLYLWDNQDQKKILKQKKRIL